MVKKSGIMHPGKKIKDNGRNQWSQIIVMYGIGGAVYSHYEMLSEEAFRY